MTPSSETGNNPTEQPRNEAVRPPDERVGGQVTDPGAADREPAERVGPTNPTNPTGPADRGVTGDSRPTWPGPTAASSVGQAPATAPGAPVGASPIDATTPSAKSPQTPVTSAPSRPTASSDTTSEEEIYRPADRRDPSVREDYVHDDADRRADVDHRLAGAATGEVRPVGDETTPDHDSDRHDDRTTPAPVTSITSGRRRSEAVPDAVDGRTDLTTDTEWRDLQAKFVDDPEATVAEAATLIERDLAGLRSKLAGGSTEDLRNAFKRYRGLHESLR
ncbi:hypothetical protein LWF15_32325 [Kineosporia rhizophila]|uniref:hypothetical protein n=1 Tax=Kineosporia rhizophila TaxID=84633 RepID=UPI001E5CA397|nr:hypothetical protein [Kineosporia rhizophila]MCE0540190.1 hypothetical protein [Kineosporia rhizophila]